jgi:DNA polymerase-3 subunit delta'
VGATVLRSLERGRVSPSYLLEGPDEEALIAAGRALAAALILDTPPRDLDRAAHARVLSGAHPDLHVLTRDKATVISVDALAAVLERAFTSPMEGERQVFLIHPAEAMDPAGVARYLKALEEPPARTSFVLLSTRAERLPETVLSRCRRLRFPLLPAHAVEAALREEGVPAPEAAAAARAALGSLGRARRLVRHGIPGHVEALARAVGEGHGLARAADEVHAALARSSAAEAEESESEVDTKRERVRQAVRDLLHALCVEARDAACGRRSALGLAPDGALRLLESLQALDRAVSQNVTPAMLVLEAVVETARACSLASRGA